MSVSHPRESRPAPCARERSTLDSGSSGRLLKSCGTGGGRAFLQRGGDDTSAASPSRPHLAEGQCDGIDRRRERRRMTMSLHLALCREAHGQTAQRQGTRPGHGSRLWAATVRQKAVRGGRKWNAATRTGSWKAPAWMNCAPGIRSSCVRCWCSAAIEKRPGLIWPPPMPAGAAWKETAGGFALFQQ